MYLCRECGNTENFSATQDVTEYCTESISVDGEGTIIDWGDRESYDGNVTRYAYNIECDVCGSSDITDFVNLEELEEAKREDGHSSNEDDTWDSISPNTHITNLAGKVDWKATYKRRRKE